MMREPHLLGIKLSPASWLTANENPIAFSSRTSSPLFNITAKISTAMIKSRGGAGQP